MIHFKKYWKVPSPFEDWSSFLPSIDACFEETSKVLRDFGEDITGPNHHVKDNTLFIELPGVGKENIKLEVVKEDTIKVKWVVKEGEKETTKEAQFLVPCHKDADADYKDGILSIKFIVEEKNTGVREIKIK